MTNVPILENDFCFIQSWLFKYLGIFRKSLSLMDGATMEA